MTDVQTDIIPRPVPTQTLRTLAALRLVRDIADRLIDGREVTHAAIAQAWRQLQDDEDDEPVCEAK